MDGMGYCRQGLLRGRDHEAPQKKLPAAAASTFLYFFTLLLLRSPLHQLQLKTANPPCLALPRLAVPCLAAPSLFQATPKPLPWLQTLACHHHSYHCSLQASLSLPCSLLSRSGQFSGSATLRFSSISTSSTMHVCLIHPHTRNQFFIRPSLPTSISKKTPTNITNVKRKSTLVIPISVCYYPYLHSAINVILFRSSMFTNKSSIGCSYIIKT